MSRMRKMRAFTLPEVMITLVLSIIIISVAYFSYNYLLRGFLKYRAINDKVSDHCRATNYLDNLMQRSDEVLKTREGLLFLKGGKEIKQIVFNEKCILFKTSQNEADTINLDLKRSAFFWKEDSMLKVKSPVQKITLEINFFGGFHRLIFEKPYDSENLIRLDSLYNSLQ